MQICSTVSSTNKYNLQQFHLLSILVMRSYLRYKYNNQAGWVSGKELPKTINNLLKVIVLPMNVGNCMVGIPFESNYRIIA